MTKANERFPDIIRFYAARGGGLAGEVDFGVWWLDGRPFPRYRVSWVAERGDIYAVNQRTGEIELLGTTDLRCTHGFHPLGQPIICAARDEIERKLEGWADRCLGETHGLDWVREHVTSNTLERDRLYGLRLARKGTGTDWSAVAQRDGRMS